MKKQFLCILGLVLLTCCNFTPLPDMSRLARGKNTRTARSPINLWLATLTATVIQPIATPLRTPIPIPSIPPSLTKADMRAPSWTPSPVSSSSILTTLEAERKPEDMTILVSPTGNGRLRSFNKVVTCLGSNTSAYKWWQATDRWSRKIPMDHRAAV